MSRRHNQYRNRRTRELGGEDMDWQDKKTVMDIMASRGYACYSNMYLLTRGDPPMFTLMASVPTAAQREKWRLAARPDVSCCDIHDHRLRLVIEIDGKVHRGQLDSRDLYDELKIPHIVLNKEYLEKEGITWEDWIAQGLERIRGSKQ